MNRQEKSSFIYFAPYYRSCYCRYAEDREQK